MAIDTNQAAPRVENFQTSDTGYDTPISSASIFKNQDTQSRTTRSEPDVLEFSNPFIKQDAAAPVDETAGTNKTTKVDKAPPPQPVTEPMDAPSQLALADQPAEKPLRNNKIPDFEKFTPEQQEKTATDLAKQIAEKSFTPSPELRDKIREAMLRVLMDGNPNGPGDEAKLDKFVKQMNDKLPPGMSLKMDRSDTNKDLAAFKERAQGAIDKQPGMKMGSFGQLQLLKTENGTTKVADKMHYAASIKKPVTKNA
jgi:hypothetical protein